MDKRRLHLIVVCSFASAYILHVASRQLSMLADLDTRVTAPAAAVSAASRSLRPNYPYSVIAGGAYSAAELRYASERDRVVNNHYADFNMQSARLVTLTQDRFQYVSYRLKDRIFWTHRKLRIPKGEVLLTDGKNFARTRCGNRLSSQPKPNTAREEPSERVLSLPPFSPPQLKGGEMKLALAPPLGELAQSFPDLPFDLPRLAPYVPAPVVGTMPLAQQIWPPISSYQPTVVPISPGFAPAPGSSSTPVATPSGSVPGTTPAPPVVTPAPPGITPVPPVITPPIIPPTPPGPPIGDTPLPPPINDTPLPPPIGDTPLPPPINEVPEPASLSLLAFGVCLSLGFLAWMMRAERRPEE